MAKRHYLCAAGPSPSPARPGQGEDPGFQKTVGAAESTGGPGIAGAVGDIGENACLLIAALALLDELIAARKGRSRRRRDREKSGRRVGRKAAARIEPSRRGLRTETLIRGSAARPFAHGPSGFRGSIETA